MNSQLKALQLQQKPNSSQRQVALVEVVDDSEQSANMPVPSGHLKNSLNPKTTPVSIACPPVERFSQRQPLLSQTINTQQQMSQAQYIHDNVLEFSPFNFSMGINQRRLLKGQSSFNRVTLVQNLSCLFCN